jgi:hypothetical protein
MRGANALLVVPKGTGVVPAHSFLPSLLIGSLQPPHPSSAFHRQAAGGGTVRRAALLTQPYLATRTSSVRVCGVRSWPRPRAAPSTRQ